MEIFVNAKQRRGKLRDVMKDLAGFDFVFWLNSSLNIKSINEN